MNYRSVADLNADIKRWISKLPEDLDLIVGIPRSGLLVANLLALHLNLPLTDFEGLCKGRILHIGRRYDKILDLSQRNKVLVVDDSLHSGAQMEQVKAKIRLADLQHQIYYAAVYITPHGYNKVDFWYEIIDTPRVFEWNVMHHGLLTNSCVDIDGVLCRDPTPEENDDGEKYRHFLANVNSLIRPSVEIGWLVTCRLEKYRDLTVEWLGKHNIKYRNLVMIDLPDKETRLSLGNHALFKAEVYESTGASLFIESSHNQAEEIVKMTGKSVLCVETWNIINADFLSKSYHKGKEYSKKLKERPFGTIYKSMRFVKRRLSRLKWKILAYRSKKE